MKNKTKIMLGLSVLTAGTLAAGATGTLAWFTTNKTAKATYNNIKVQGTSGSLKAVISGVTKDSGANASEAGTDVSAQGGTISDVSSKDGVNFYQPDWKNGAGNDQEVNSVKDVSTRTGFFTQYLITVSNASTDTAAGNIDVELRKLTITVTKDGATNEAMKNWVRVAVMPNATTKTNGDSKLLVPAAAEKPVYLFQNDASLNKYVNGTTLKDKKADIQSLSDGDIKVAGEALEDITVAKNLKAGATNQGQIGVSVWVEGTSGASASGETSQDDIKGATISVAMEFGAKDSETK